MISTTRYIHLVLIGLGLLGLFLLFKWLLYSAVNTLFLVLAGVLFATFIRGLSRLIFGRFKHLSEKVGIVITLLFLAGSLATFIVFLAPQVAEQMNELANELPRALNTLSENYPGFEWVREYVASAEDKSPAFTDKITGKMLGVFATTFGVIGSFFVVLFVGLYLCFSPYSYIYGIFQLIPSGWRERADEVIQALDYTLSHWLIGRFVGIMIVSLSTYAGLLFLGIPLPLSLALLAGLLTFIPNIGPIVSAIPPVLLGVMESSTTALSVIALYVIIQSLESYIITPLVQQREVSLPPVLSLTSQILLASLFGFLGLVMATPMAAIILVLVKMLYVEDVLGEPTDVNGTDGEKVHSRVGNE